MSFVLQGKPASVREAVSDFLLSVAFRYQVLDLDDIQHVPNLNNCIQMVRDDAYPVLRFVNRDLASPDSGSNEFTPITRYPFPVPPLCRLEPYVHFASILEAIMKFS